jgi:hypothetical protein
MLKGMPLAGIATLVTFRGFLGANGTGMSTESRSVGDGRREGGGTESAGGSEEKMRG